MTARIAILEDYRPAQPAPRAAWPLHRMLQAACEATAWTDGTRWHVDGRPATDAELRSIAELIDSDLAAVAPGDARVRGKHPGVECDSWLVPTLRGQHLERHWNHFKHGGAQ